MLQQELQTRKGVDPADLAARTGLWNKKEKLSLTNSETCQLKTTIGQGRRVSPGSSPKLPQTRTIAISSIRVAMAAAI